MKKIYLASILAIMLIAATLTSAFAATITVTNPVDANTYKVYKILDAKKIEGTDKYQYTIHEDSPWYTAVNSAGNGVTVHPAENASSKTHVVTFEGNNEAAIIALVAALKPVAESQTPVTTLQKADGATEATGEVTDPGYYFVTTSTGALCNLLTIDSSVSIFDKNEEKFDKSLNYPENELHRDFAIGETVKFKIESLVPVSIGYDNYTYRLTDTMPAEINLLPDTIEIFVDGEKLTANFNIDEKDDRHFSATLNIKALNDAGKATKPVLVTYDGKVNDKAEFGRYENKATLDHGPVTSFTEENKDKYKHYEDKEFILNHRVVIDKTDGKTNAKLPGAAFALVKEDAGKAFFYRYDDANKAVTWVEIAGAATAKDAMDQKKADAMKDSITIKTTDTNGAASFPGLRNGTYHLIETTAPKGYNSLLEPVAISVSADGGESSVYEHIATVQNIGGTTMPTTGGIGTTIFYIAGGVIILGAIVILAVKKRAKNDN